MDDNKIIIDSIQKELEKFSEEKLTKEIIIPLFESLGYYKVEYQHGGINEKGKDVICWEYNKIGDLEVTVIQVKVIKFSANVSTKNSLPKIMPQLIQASYFQIEYIDGNKYLPKSIILITPFPLSTKIINSISEIAFSNRIESKFNIIDGIKLATLLFKNMPEKIPELINLYDSIYISSYKALSNFALLNAFNKSVETDITELYCDLDLRLGKTQTSIFLAYKIYSDIKKINLSYSRWEIIENKIKLIEKLSKNEFLKKANSDSFLDNIKEIQNDYKIKFNNSKEKILLYIKEFKDIKNQILLDKYIKSEPAVKAIILSIEKLILKYSHNELCNLIENNLHQFISDLLYKYRINCNYDNNIENWKKIFYII